MVCTYSKCDRNGKYHLFAFYDHSEDVLKEKELFKTK